MRAVRSTGMTSARRSSSSVRTKRSDVEPLRWVDRRLQRLEVLDGDHVRPRAEREAARPRRPGRWRRTAATRVEHDEVVEREVGMRERFLRTALERRASRRWRTAAAPGLRAAPPRSRCRPRAGSAPGRAGSRRPRCRASRAPCGTRCRGCAGRRRAPSRRRSASHAAESQAASSGPVAASSSGAPSRCAATCASKVRQREVTASIANASTGSTASRETRTPAVPTTATRPSRWSRRGVRTSASPQRATTSSS